MSGTGGEARLRRFDRRRRGRGLRALRVLPESWRREERDRAGMLNVVKMGLGIIGVIVAIAAMVALVMAWTRGRFDRRAFKLVGLAVFASAMVAAMNQWPAFAMRLQTTEPLTSQIALYAASLTLAIALYALFSGLLSGVARTRPNVTRPMSACASCWIRGVCAGLLLTGVDMVLSLVSPVTGSSPTWPSFKAENGWLSWIDPVASGIYGAIATIAGAIVVLYWLDRLTAGWTRRRALSFVVLALIGAASCGRARRRLGRHRRGRHHRWSALALPLRNRVALRPAAVPALVSVNLVIGWIGSALIKGTPTGALMAVLGIATTLAVALAATRYLLSPGQRLCRSCRPRRSGLDAAAEPCRRGSRRARRFRFIGRRRQRERPSCATIPDSSPLLTSRAVAPPGAGSRVAVLTVNGVTVITVLTVNGAHGGEGAHGEGCSRRRVLTVRSRHDVHEGCRLAGACTGMPALVEF